MSGVKNQSLSIHPDELKFQFELEKQICCDLRVSNTTDQHVAFKVKTTSPKKYFVRPNTGVIQPWDSCMIRVTLQAQQDYPPDMQCKDKFLLQSTKVAPETDIDELPQDTFNKDSGRTIEDSKLRVVYIFPQSGSTNAEDGYKSSDSNMQGSANYDDNKAVQRLRIEKDAAVRQAQQLQRELDTLKRRRSRRNSGFSFKFAIFVALIGIMVGLLLNLSLSSPPPTPGPVPSAPPTDSVPVTAPSTPPTE
uniref:MSP domain-containing protein n=1 Tax=Daucus carota subsp. sativus TaxID=79200 RepID=A0A162AZB1_DAUCS|nr:PREDICTED: vesicle-associated protein 2-1-like [Daucus carota subsp. sativus]